MVIVVVVYLFLKGNKTTLGKGNCTDFSTKDGYTGCMSLKNGKENRCKFKVNNRISESTQKMEFDYQCLEK